MISGKENRISSLLMAPRRNNSSPSAIDVHNMINTELDVMDHFPNLHIKLNKFTRCCVPTGDCFKFNSLDYGLIQSKSLNDYVRVVCSNEQCNAGQYMHRECFDAWEDGVLTYMKSVGRARSWSERQRQQNLWTKKGYDLVFKACGCKCGRGYLKKDLDFQISSDRNSLIDDSSKKKKKRNRSNHKSSMIIASNNNNVSHINKNDSNDFIVTSLLESSEITNNNTFGSSICIENKSMLFNGNRRRTNSLASSLDEYISPPASTASDTICSPIEMIQKEKSKVEAYSERVR